MGKSGGEKQLKQTHTLSPSRLICSVLLLVTSKTVTVIFCANDSWEFIEAISTGEKMQWRRSFGNNSDIVGVCLCRLNLALGTIPVDRLGGFVQLGSWQFCQQMRRWGSCWLTNKKDSISCCKVDCCNYCWKSGGWSHLKFQGRGNSAHQWDLPSLPISFFPTLLNQTIIPKPKPTPTPVPASIENWSCIWCVACKSEQQIQFLPQEFNMYSASHDQKENFWNYDPSMIPLPRCWRVAAVDYMIAIASCRGRAFAFFPSIGAGEVISDPWHSLCWLFVSALLTFPPASFLSRWNRAFKPERLHCPLISKRWRRRGRAGGWTSQDVSLPASMVGHSMRWWEIYF